MYNMPLVSVVTPAYNAEKFIETTLKSVMCQTYANVEHIVIDDGSTDKTADILRKYEGTCNLKWFSKPNEGQAITLNKCIDLARGELVVILNADDALFDTKVIANLVRNRETDVVYGHMAIIDERNRLLKIQYAMPRFSYDRLLQAHFAYFICYRREIVCRYRFDPTLDFVMDYEQCLRMARDGVRFGCLNRILLAYRRHEATKSVSRRKDQRAETKEVQKRYGRRFSIYYLFMNLLDRFILLCLKICGVKTVVELYFHPEKFHLAFPIRFGSLLKTVTGQLVPYIWLKCRRSKEKGASVVSLYRARGKAEFASWQGNTVR